MDIDKVSAELIKCAEEKFGVEYDPVMLGLNHTDRRIKAIEKFIADGGVGYTATLDEYKLFYQLFYEIKYGKPVPPEYDEAGLLIRPNIKLE